MEKSRRSATKYLNAINGNNIIVKSKAISKDAAGFVEKNFGLRKEKSS